MPLRGSRPQTRDRLTTCPKCGRQIQLDWGAENRQARASKSTLHAAFYAMILKSQGLEPAEIRRHVRERYRSRNVQAQLAAPRSVRYA
jgi:hypothetical protein